MLEKIKKNKVKIYLGGGAILLIVIILLLVSCSNRYKVELKVGASTYYQGSIKKGDTLDKIEAPTMEGYTFDGWYNGDEKVDLNTPIDEDMVLVAKFSKNTYTITLDYGNGKVEEKVVEYEDTLANLETPTKKGYTFLGWYQEDKEYDLNSGIHGDIQLTAKWQKTTTTIKKANYVVEHYLMDLDGENYTLKDTDKLTGNVGDKVKPALHTYTGFSAPKKEELEIKEDGSSTLKYYYERNTYTLTILKDKGIQETYGSGTYYYGSSVEITAVVKEGYAFKEWTTKENASTFIYEVKAKDETITASSQAIKYTIQYELADGVCKNCQTKSYTVEKEITLPTVIKAGYTFNGWKVNNSTEVITKINPGDYHEDLILTADFTANTDTPYTVFHVFMDANGKYKNITNKKDCTEENLCTVEEFVGTTDATVEVPLLSTIEEWYQTPEVQELTIKGDGSTTLVYQYARKQYTLTVIGDKGIESTTGSGSYYYEQVVSNIGYTLKEGYAFEQYSVELDNGTYKMGASDVEITITSTPIHYTITYDTECSGCETEYTVEEDVTLPTLEKEGYTFNGWKVNGSTTSITSFEKGTYHDNLTLTADFTANTNTPYKVFYYFMDKEGNYPEVASQEITDLTGTTDQPTGFVAEEKDGFDSPILKESFDGETLDIQKVMINGDGSTTLKFFYARKQYALTVVKTDGVQEVTITPNKDKYYFEEQIEFVVTAKDGYHLLKHENQEISNEDNFTYQIIDGVNEITIESAGNTFTVNYHDENGTNLIQEENLVYNANLKLKANTYTKDSYTLTIENYDNKQGTKEIEFKNNFAGWATSQGSTEIVYQNEENVIPTSNGQIIDLYAVFETEKKNLAKLPDQEEYYFYKYVDAEEKDVTEENYTISEDTTITAKWREVMTLTKFDAMILSNIDQNTFTTNVEEANKKVTALISGAKDKIYTQMFDKFMPLAGSVQKALDNPLIAQIAVDGVVMEGMGTALNTKISSLAGGMGGQVSNMDSKQVNVEVLLDKETAITKDRTFKISYDITIRALLKKEELDASGDSALDILTNQNTNTDNKHFTPKKDGNTITFEYAQDHANDMFESSVLAMGTSTALRKFFENPLLKDIEITMTNVVTLDSFHPNITIVPDSKGENKVIKLTKENCNDFYNYLYSDMIKFRGGGYGYNYELYQNGDDSKRYKLTVKLNLYVDTDAPTEYTILYGPSK